MTYKCNQTPYSLHPYIQQAYLDTHSWLDSRSECSGYKSKTYPQITSMLTQNNFMSAATQFYAYFPAHYFKVIHALNTVVRQEILVDWLNRNPRICLVDIGCGAGAGSVAFLDMLLQLQENDLIKNPIELFCLGVDPNLHAIALYYQILTSVKTKLSATKINFDFACQPKGIPSVTSWLINQLNQKRESWQLPNLNHVLIMQINIVSPLNEVYQADQKDLKILKDLGVALDNQEGQFGTEQALAYKSIFEGVAIDHMHIITVATDGYMLDKRVEEMGVVINQRFSSNNHRTILLGEEWLQATFINPQGSFYAWNGKPVTPKPFYVNATSITNQDWRGDKDWHEVTSEENLKLAWARARYNFLKEAFIDEIEIKLFDRNLDEKIADLRKQLLAYAQDVAQTDDNVFYKIPKSTSKVRPRGLSRMEEELLSVAIIQRLGNKESQLRQSSYAYRISKKHEGRESEYLYQPWFNAYQSYLNDARLEAQKLSTKAILKVDIKSFYEKIVQNQLVDLAAVTLTKSQRIQWLIKLLLSKNLDAHELGQGIIQGNVGSGFYANIYLTSIDMLFGTTNEWNVKFFRYADDMIFVIPEQENGKPIKQAAEEIEEILQQKLNELRLELNNTKTELFDDINVFLESIETDKILKQLDEQFIVLTNSLWILDEQYRANFKDYLKTDEAWWYYTKQYCKCLQQIRYYITPYFSSRYIFKYLFNEPRRKKELNRPYELSLPDLPSKETFEEYQKWAAVFIDQNLGWVTDKNLLHQTLIKVFFETWKELSTFNTISPSQERLLQTRLRFITNKLSILGFAPATKVIVEILINYPWIIHNLSNLIEDLAYQGFADELIIIFQHYEKTSYLANEYLRAITLRAIRFLPTIYDNHWEKITTYTIIGSVAERLMATETWLSLSSSPKFEQQRIFIPQISAILTDSISLPHRLQKNYILLLGEYNVQPMSYPEMGDDIMLRDAYQLGISGEAFELFSYQEPKIIRDEFYSGQRVDDKDYVFPSR